MPVRFSDNFKRAQHILTLIDVPFDLVASPWKNGREEGFFLTICATACFFIERPALAFAEHRVSDGIQIYYGQSVQFSIESLHPRSWGDHDVEAKEVGMIDFTSEEESAEWISKFFVERFNTIKNQ
jgi:hypothetical protein